ncbi:MAG: DUF998 domain-containing protein [Gammaproteobacteria bacterium]|nr:DUF998 domain-containing protein [Gammaproteobacteria bacterium]
MIRSAVIFCALAILFGPFYTDPGYDWTRHSISELAGQATSNAWIMRVGLLSLGLACVVGFFRVRSQYNIFLLIFGVSIALTGIFPHRPFDADKEYSELLDQLHSWFASLGGFFAVLGFVYRTVQANSVSEKIVSASLASLYTLFSAAMFYWPEYLGVFQRVIFGSFIAWVLAYASTDGEE